METLQEILSDVRVGLRTWWSGLRRRRSTDWELISFPEPENVIFTPLVPNSGAAAPAGKGAAGTAKAHPVCPVTRQELQPGSRIYQCRVCGMCYSLEGWQFLKQVDRGHCCACRCRNSVLPMIDQR